MTYVYKTEIGQSLNQTQYIKHLINKHLEAGQTSKKQIYEIILKDSPEIPRPTIRRACRELISELQKKVEILTSPSTMDRSVP